MASKRARMMWENGAPLGDAWRHFASDADQKALDQLPSALEAMSNYASGNRGNGWMSVADAATSGVRASQARREAEKRLQDELLTDLFNEQLFAIGYREFPSLGSVPVMIDANHFDEGMADWAQSKFEANGRVWNRVRVSMLYIAPAREVPNSKNAIDNTIRALLVENNKFSEVLRKTQCDLVREKLGRIYQIGNGLSDQNITKRIVAIAGIKRINNKPN